MSERELEELGVAISRLEAPRARDAFRARLRARLILAAEERWSRRRAPFFAFPFALAFTPRLAVAAAVFALLFVGGGTVAGATSLPGDPAYGLKQAFEQVELTLARDEAARTEVLARQASRRLEELQKVSDARPEIAPTATQSYQEAVERFRGAVEALAAAPTGEKHEAALEVARAAAAKHLAVLKELKKRDATPGLERAIKEAEELLEKAEEEQERIREEKERRGKDRKDERPGVAPTPTPTRSPQPTSTPRSPRPTATPKATESPKPTETPEPSETPRPTGR